MSIYRAIYRRLGGCNGMGGDVGGGRERGMASCFGRGCCCWQFISDLLLSIFDAIISAISLPLFFLSFFFLFSFFFLSLSGCERLICRHFVGIATVNPLMETWRPE